MKDFPTTAGKHIKKQIWKGQPRSIASTIKLVVAWILLVVIALFFVQQRITYIRTEKRVNRLLLQKRRIMSSILPLKLEERYLTRFDIVEKTAKETLLLQKPQNKQIIKLKIDSVEETQN